MKLIVMMIAAIALAGCAQLQKGEMQPVKRISVKEEIYSTTCSGAVEDWFSCNRKAQNTCPNGYEALSKEESSTTSFREMTFRCK